MHRGYIYAKIPHLHSFYKYLYPEICRCPRFYVHLCLSIFNDGPYYPKVSHIYLLETPYFSTLIR